MLAKFLNQQMKVIASELKNEVRVQLQHDFSNLPAEKESTPEPIVNIVYSNSLFSELYFCLTKFY